MPLRTLVLVRCDDNRHGIVLRHCHGACDASCHDIAMAVAGGIATAGGSAMAVQWRCHGNGYAIASPRKSMAMLWKCEARFSSLLS